MPLLERKALYRDVWSRPCTKIAAELGISSSALKRICEAMDIPTPKAGHWTRVECGKKVKRVPLPKAKSTTRLSWDVDVENSRRQKRTRVRREKEKAKEAEQLAELELPAVALAPDTENLHRLVKATRTQLREDWSKKAWDQRKNRKRIDARISDGVLDRALIFLDAFVRGVEALGLKFACELDQRKPTMPRDRYQRREEPSGSCWIEVRGERLGFILKEKKKRIRVTDEEELRRTWGRRWEDVPSGMLEFSLDVGWGFGRTSSWKDGQIMRIEQSLGQMIATVPLAGEHLRKGRLEREAAERRREEHEALRRRMHSVQWEEEEAAKSLMAQAEASRQAAMVREYVERVRVKHLAEAGNGPPENSAEDLWLRWAAVHADSLDPLGDGSWPWQRRTFQQMGSLFPKDRQDGTWR